MIIDKDHKIAILNDLVENGIITDTSSYADIVSNDEIDTVTELIESLANLGIITSASHDVNKIYVDNDRETVVGKAEEPVVVAEGEVKVEETEQVEAAEGEVKVEEVKETKPKSTTSTKKTTKKKNK